MEDTRYGLKVSLPVPYDEAVARATEALEAQGFGVLTTIDVKQTLKAKLDRDFRNARCGSGRRRARIPALPDRGSPDGRFKRGAAAISTPAHDERHGSWNDDDAQ